MTYIYYIDGEKFISDKVLWFEISSPNEQTPALENLITGVKEWVVKGYTYHRLTGPAYIASNGTKYFYLNGKRYENIHDWLKDHPNQDNSFQIEMLLKYS
jgi:hypothetical protein